MNPRPLKLLTGQGQRFIDRVAVCGHQRRISFQEFLPLFASHDQVYEKPDEVLCVLSNKDGDLNWWTSSEGYVQTARFLLSSVWIILRTASSGAARLAQALGGIVHERATFAMAGTGVQYVNPFAGIGLIVFNSAGFPKVPNPSYLDSNADTGLAFSLGGGFDIRLSNKLSFRVAMNYDPTFLVRPAIRDPTLLKTTPSERDRQSHTRLSVGFVWGI
jgi:hypothetical protein